MIELQSLSKSFGPTAAVAEVSLHIARGQICALVGPSGSGKSTLLRMINRLVEPDRGRILIEGVDIALLPPVLLRRRIGYVIQSIGLFPHWSVARNVATVPRLLDWPRAQVAGRVEELLDLVGLDPSIYADRFPHQLSGGQQQRVGVARALAGDPSVLLMDEPFGAVDPPTRRGLQDSLLDIQKRTDKTIILVTHDVDEAIRLGDTIAMLEHGRLVQAAPPQDLLENPANEAVAAFFGGPRRGLRVLQTTPVAARADFARSGQGPAIDATATLDEAVSLMVTGHTGELTVMDHVGQRQGALSIDDLVAK